MMIHQARCRRRGTFKLNQRPRTRRAKAAKPGLRDRRACALNSVIKQIKRFVVGRKVPGCAQDRERAAQRSPAPARLACQPAGDSGAGVALFLGFLKNVFGAMLPHRLGNIGGRQRLGGSGEHPQRMLEVLPFLLALRTSCDVGTNRNRVVGLYVVGTESGKLFQTFAASHLGSPSCRRVEGITQRARIVKVVIVMIIE